jgi:tRNA U38,U39,U40 pseudouridine synthase TruA
LLIDSNLIPNPCQRNLNEIKLSEAFHTDSGVHATAQAISCWLTLPCGLRPWLLPQFLGSNLPANSPVRIWAPISVISSFRVQKCADSRRYHYLILLSAFSDPSADHITKLHAEVLLLFVRCSALLSVGLARCP